MHAGTSQSLLATALGRVGGACFLFSLFACFSCLFSFFYVVSSLFAVALEFPLLPPFFLFSVPAF
ncbi:hypothetical protein B0H13DRAFT_2134477, partial [Mycena leptocephala]